MRQKFYRKSVHRLQSHLPIVLALYFLLLLLNFLFNQKLFENSVMFYRLLDVALLLLYIPIFYTIFRLDNDRKVTGSEDIDDFRYQITHNEILNGIIVSDSTGRIVDMNETAEEILGIGLSEAQAYPLTDKRWSLVDNHGKPLSEEELPFSLTLRTGRPIKHFIAGTVNFRQDKKIWLEVSANPIYDRNNQIECVILVFHDMTEQMHSVKKLNEYNEQLRQLSFTDCLIDMPNRRFFNSYLSQIWADSKKTGTPITLIMIDVDYIKEYSMNHGFVKGEEVLKKAAISFRSVVKEPGAVARINGEQFAVVYPGLFGRQIEELERQLRLAIDQLISTKSLGEDIKEFTMFMGTSSMVALDHEGWQILLAEADEELQKARKQHNERMLI